MRRHAVLISVIGILVFAACQAGGTPAPGATATLAPGATPFDPSAITGSVTLGNWESSPAEGEALDAAVDGFRSAYPNIDIKRETVAGDYRAQMITNFGAQTAPDIFFVNAEYTPEWIREGFLLALDDYIAAQGFDTSTFFKGYLDTFRGPDGKQYGLPKDGNTIAMAYNTDLVPTAPTTLDELVSTAEGLKGQGSLKAPMCLNPGLDRGLAFIYAQGGSLLNADNTAAEIDSDASKAAVQWYMDLFKNGLGISAGDLGDSWCGEALGKGDVAIVFEGGWLLGYMRDTYPDVKWAFAEMPAGSSGSKVTISFTAAYGIGVDSPNKDQAWVVMQYLAGPDGMKIWTEGGIAVPSRSDVPVPEGFDIIVKGGDYARPGSGFMPGYNDVQKAFQDAFVAETTNKTFSADPVVAATKAAIDTALAQ